MVVPKRYRTAHDTAEPTVRIIKMLPKIVSPIWCTTERTEAHIEVNERVKVKLMEKRVKSHVGNVMVTKVTDQYKTLGMARKVARMTRARRPIEPCVASASVMRNAISSRKSGWE